MYLIVSLIAIAFVLKLTIQLKDIQNCNVKLMLQLEETNKSYVNITLQLDEVKEEMNEKITPLHTERLRTQNKKSTSPPKLFINYKKPGTDHPFILINDVTIEKFRIIPDERRNNYKFVYGLPTIAREQTYILQTLDSLFKDVVSIEEMNVLFVIIVADLDTNKCGAVIDLVKMNHGQFIDRGMLEIICPHPSLYPSLANARRTLKDPDDRFMWRSKQNLDFAFLMWYASSKGEYYIQLEDDIIATDRYAYYVNDYVDKVKNDYWFLIHFSQLGFIGKLMRSNDLMSFAQYLLLFYTSQPCDWLLYDYVRSLVCYSGLDEHGCMALFNSIILIHTPSLFQHMGTVSSLGGKVQNLKDPGFEINKKHKAPTYSNPRAIVTTTFSVYDHNSAIYLYNGEGVLWSDKVLEGNNIVVEFYELEELKGINILTGSKSHPLDTLLHGVVEYKQSKNGDYELWAEFMGGKVYIYTSESKLIHAIRVTAIEQQDNWLLISHFECLK